MLPAISAMACALRVPQHFLDHARGYTYDEMGNRIRKADAAQTIPGSTDTTEQIAAIYLCYPEAVRQRISTIQDAAMDGDYCENPDLFVTAMNTASADILDKIASFRWTLRADGYNLRPGGPGCGTNGVFGPCRSPGESEITAHPPLRNRARLQIEVGK